MWVIIQFLCKVNIQAQRGDNIHQLPERRVHNFPSSFQHEIYIYIISGNLKHNNNTKVILVIIHTIHLTFNNQLPIYYHRKLRPKIIKLACMHSKRLLQVFLPKILCGDLPGLCVPLRSVSTQLAYRKVVIFPQLSPTSYKNGVRIGIGRKIGKTEVERVENGLTRASYASGCNHSQVPHASVTHPRFSTVAGRQFGSETVVRVDRRSSVRFISPRGYQVSRGTRVGLHCRVSQSHC